MIEGTVRGLIKSKCIFNGVIITHIEDQTVDWKNQKFKHKRMSIKLKKAKEMLSNDIMEWINDDEKIRYVPLIRLIFEHDFKFDKSVWDLLEMNEKRYEINKNSTKEVKEIRLSLLYHNDLYLGKRIELNIDIEEECVLMYGERKTHDHNINKILDFVKNIYNHTNPYYGWMGGEVTLLYDAYNCFINNKMKQLFDVKKWYSDYDFIIVGNKMINKLKKYDIDKLQYPIINLQNGGKIIRFS